MGIYQKYFENDLEVTYTEVNNFEGFVRKFLNEIGDLLIEKNKSYGNSAIDPIRVFSKADRLEQIKVRIDDKLSRIRNGNNSFNEDTEKDLIGYLVLKKYVEHGSKE